MSDIVGDRHGKPLGTSLRSPERDDRWRLDDLVRAVVCHDDAAVR
jgi:hypothetical protein